MNCSDRSAVLPRVNIAMLSWTTAGCQAAERYDVPRLASQLDEKRIYEIVYPDTITLGLSITIPFGQVKEGPRSVSTHYLL